MQEIELGSDEHYLECWLQFNVMYRANVAAACHHAAVDGQAGASTVAALECYQQYLLSLEDLGTWANAIPRWVSGEGLAKAMEVASANWNLFKRLESVSASDLVAIFHLPRPDEVGASKLDDYDAALEEWVLNAQSIGRSVKREGENGKPLSERALNKFRHGQHFFVADDGQQARAYFYPNMFNPAPGAALRALALSPDAAERFLRLTYDNSRLLSAILRTLFVSRFGRAPVNPWRPQEEQSKSLSVQDILEDLRRIDLPVSVLVERPRDS